MIGSGFDKLSFKKKVFKTYAIVLGIVGVLGVDLGRLITLWQFAPEDQSALIFFGCIALASLIVLLVVNHRFEWLVNQIEEGEGE